MRKLSSEPVLITAVLVAIVNLATGLGYLSESEGQSMATVLESVVVLALGFVARSKVVPVDEEESTYVIRHRERRG